MAELSFREASREDVGLILTFIKKLADYEHRLDEVIATEEDLEKWIFDKEHANVIFALEDGKEIGFALYFLSFSHISAMQIFIWKTSLLTRNIAEKDMEQHFLKN